MCAKQNAQAQISCCSRNAKKLLLIEEPEPNPSFRAWYDSALTEEGEPIYLFLYNISMIYSLGRICLG